MPAAEVIEAIRSWEEAKHRKIFNASQVQLLKAGDYDFSLRKISENEFQLQHYSKEVFKHENLVLQPGQPHYSEWEFQVSSGEQDLYFQLKVSGEEGEIEEILLELDGSQSMEIPVSLEAGYSCIFDGMGNLLIYDAKGSLKKKFEVAWKQLSLQKGKHTLSVSCNFSSDGDLELQGIVKLKDRVELITTQ